MGGPRDYHSKGRSQTERQTPYDSMCTWNLNYDTNELIYETETDSKPEQTWGCQEGECIGRGMEWESGVSRCKLV